jgi:uncharacterized membrane protein
MARTTVDTYLRELDRELRDLPPARRRELLEEIRDHIDSALEGPAAREADVRNVLDRLGDPADIAAEARERFEIRRPKAGAREILALVLLPLGGFLWVIGWVVGAILLATSKVWTSREKLIGLLVLPGGLLPAGGFGLVGARTCQEVIENGRVVSQPCSGGMPIWLGWAIMAVLVLAPVWTVWFLARRMNRRAASA